ncbi:alpha/beta hydrolase family protein [Nocardia sp. NPDC003482]
MFEPFVGRYTWNLSVGLALATGGLIGEVDRASRPLYHRDFDSEDDATRAFFAEWCALANSLVELAADDERNGRCHSAGEKHLRAAVYYLTAERMQARTYAPRQRAYRQGLDSFAKYLDFTRQPAERIDIPFGDTAFPAIFHRADTGSRAPVVVFFNGLDSMKEQFYGTGTAQELRRRGISTLIVDNPGSGEALRLRGLTATVDTERWAAACVDYLETRDDVDAGMIGLLAWSLGGYYGPRATAFEPRIRFGVAWGANYDWGQVQLDRLRRVGERPVPHYWDHVRWVWGAADMDEFLALAPRITLRGVAEHIRVPFLVVHGEHDRQISLRYAHLLYDDLRASPKRRLEVFTDRTGGVEHCSIDNLPVVRDFICDWIDETVTELRADGAATR